MITGYRTILRIVLLFFICSILFVPALASQNQEVITVVLDNNYPPFSFLDHEGNLQGILIDEWMLWEQKTGIHAELHPMNWDDALHRMEAGEFDVIDTIFYNEDRAKIYDFTQPYATIDVPIFFNKNIAGISGPTTAQGFVVGAKSGDNAIDVLKKSGVDEILEFNSYEEIIQAAKDGRVVVFCVDKPPAMYFLYKAGIRDQFQQTAPLYTGAFHRAVKKGNSETLKKVEDGFSKITPSEHADIDRKWYGTPLVSQEYLKYIIAGGLVILLVLLVLMVVNRTLKRKVAQRTQELDVELKQRKKAEEELTAAYEEMTSTAEKLKQNYDELHRSQDALTQARKKLNLLNIITFQDIQNALFSLQGYIELQKDLPMDEKAGAYLKREKEVADKISSTLAFARNFQDMGINPPLWQNANQVFLVAISHLDLSKIERKNNLDNLELYADPLLETVFFKLVENVTKHGKTATEISLYYRETTDHLTLFIEDNGRGIPDADKEQIFERGYGAGKGMGLFLVREILGITGITIHETGESGKGARFEISVPKGAYRFTG
ncbi:MAG: transporter substrate-binding domain-containing protein [Methanoregula sp.]